MNDDGRPISVLDLCHAMHGIRADRHCITCAHLRGRMYPGRMFPHHYCEGFGENDWNGWDPDNVACGRWELCEEGKT